MLISDLLSTALRGVTVNKSRSLLTMLGIIIGVGSVVLMTGIGKSMEGVILGQISVLGPKSMVIFPGNGPEGGAPSARSGFDSLTQSDFAGLQKLTTVDSLAPGIFVTGRVKAGREEAEPQVLGTIETYFNNLNIELDRGRLLDATDEKAARAVAVIAPDTAQDLFLNQEPIGKQVTIKNRSFTVVGVTKPVGTAFFTNLDERIYIPLSAAQQLTDQSYYNFITMLRVGNVDLAFADVKAQLRRLHRIDNPEDDPDKDDFIVRSSAQAQDLFGSVSIGLTAFITMIAAISLIVGGIGIMNIMLVAVSERTREIGLRKAIGARKGDILRQFLVESVVLTLIGGLIGMCGGIATAYGIAAVVSTFLADYTFGISLRAIALALGMAAATGLVFGIYPAKRAADLSPMEALRYE